MLANFAQNKGPLAKCSGSKAPGRYTVDSMGFIAVAALGSFLFSRPLVSGIGPLL